MLRVVILGALWEGGRGRCGGRDGGSLEGGRLVGDCVGGDRSRRACESRATGRDWLGLVFAAPSAQVVLSVPHERQQSLARMSECLGGITAPLPALFYRLPSPQSQVNFQERCVLHAHRPLRSLRLVECDYFRCLAPKFHGKPLSLLSMSKKDLLEPARSRARAS